MSSSTEPSEALPSIPPTFPSLESTKLSSILNTIESDVIGQVQLDIMSIVKTYRTDLSNQLNSITDFEKTIIKKYLKLNDLFKKRLMENSELVNWKLNKKIDGFKITHEYLSHYKKDNGLCEINELCGDVMGKLMGIVEVLKEKNGESGGIPEIDPDRFPLLTKVFGIVPGYMESYDEVDINELGNDPNGNDNDNELINDEYEENGEELQEYEEYDGNEADNEQDVDKEVECAGSLKENENRSEGEVELESQQLTESKTVNGKDALIEQQLGNFEQEIKNIEISEHEEESQHDHDDDIEIEIEESIKTKESFINESGLNNQSTNDQIKKPIQSLKNHNTRSSTPSLGEDPLAMIERSISKYKSKQLSSVGLVLPTPSFSITTTATTTTTSSMVQNSGPSINTTKHSVISENLKKFI